MATGCWTFIHEKIMRYTIEKISTDIAEQLCRQITADLPEYFGLHECNEHYTSGVRLRDNFAVKFGPNYLGLLSLDFPYPKNGNIYWMGVLRSYHNHGIGRMLMDAASHYASDLRAVTMTVETLAPNESDENYLKTYRFYEGQGFKPLFNLKPAGYEWNMVYMAKELNHRLPMSSVDAIKTRAIHESDISIIDPEFQLLQWPNPASTYEAYCKEHKMFGVTNVRLLPATLADYPTIQNMARFYVYDRTGYMGWECPENGLFECIDFKHYFENPDEKAFLIRVADEIAGFVLLDKMPVLEPVDWNMGEFFVLAKFQGKGIANTVAREILQKHPGKWSIAVMPENIKAVKFWRKIISAVSKGGYTETFKTEDELRTAENPEPYAMNVFTFNTH